MNPKSSSSVRLLSALSEFGLTVDEGYGDDRKIKLSELALDILLAEGPHVEAWSEGVKKAALKPTMHRLLWNRYDGDLPSDHNMKVYLIREHKFNDDSAVPFIREFRRTVRFANLTPTDIIPDEAQAQTTEDLEMGSGEQGRENPKPVPATKPGSTAAAQGGASASWTVTGPKMRELPITLPSLNIAMLHVPFPMEPADFDALEAAIKAFKNALVARVSETQT